MRPSSGTTPAPNPDPAPTTAAASRTPPQTPAMRQYARFKSQHPECILFFRMGDFYEMFHDDALVAHKVLGITLTQRTEGVPMAGVPYHAVESYLRRMIEAGYRVAVCDQIQDPREAKGIVERAVTRVITPGTLIDESLLDESRANQIAAIQFLESGDDAAAVLALAELSTGRFTLVDLPPGRAADDLTRLAPSELLYVETADGAVPPRIEAIRAAINCPLTPRPAWTFRLREATETLREHYGVATLAGFGLADDDAALGPAGALLRYLLETQTPAREDQDGSAPEARTATSAGPLAHLRPPRREPTDRFVTIDAASLRSLEVQRTLRSGQTDHSLLAIFNRCRTPMGRRLLRTWLCFPLRDIQEIRDRQRAVAAFIAEPAPMLAEVIGHVQDVARIAGRISMRRATPRDLVGLGASLQMQPAALKLTRQRPPLKAIHQRLAALTDTLVPLMQLIGESCVESPPAHLREGGLFRDGADAELDEARALQRDGSTWLAAYQKRLVEQTNIASLKVGYNRVFGYYIEVTNTHQSKVPASFSRKQTLKNAERYITEELKDFEQRVTTAERRAIEREKLLFDRLCQRAASAINALIEFAEIIAELDVYQCFAATATMYGYTCPELVEEPVLEIRQGRHPVLDQTLGDRFVPNDSFLGVAMRPTIDEDEETDDATPASPSEPATLALITGPNMAGKSTYIRQAALIVLLAHTGSYVPAESARIGAVDRIFTRIGASDELHAGQSTFMVEMVETAEILHHATEKSLVILDEIGRGTSTLDGLSLAWAIAESLAAIGCRTLFATHYHELTALADRLDAVANLHVSVREWGDEIIFLYRILPGRTDRSYGIHVAKIAGLPSAAVDRATELLRNLAVQTEATTLADRRPSEVPSGGQLGLFTEYVHHPVVDLLRELDLNALSPMEAFDALRTLREQVEEQG